MLMKLMKRLLLVMSCTLLFGNLFAQEQNVMGTILEDDGSPIVGVTITNKSTNKRTQTDLNGKFSLKASKGDVLIVSAVGYIKKEMPLGDDLTPTLKLSKTKAQLDDVVVTTAFGVNRNKRTLGYAVQKVDGDEIAGTQRENFFNALQGRVAGATVTQTSGAPGSSSQIVLRGYNSVSGNNSPLIIVDGLPINNNTFNQGFLASDLPNRNNDYTNRAADINPDEIESITVLKGPEATSLYGIDAGSGAIIITTKKGKAGKPKISYDNSFRVTNVFRYPDVQTTYDNGVNGYLEPRTRNFFGPKFQPGTYLFDNVRNFFQDGFNQKHNLSVEGGKEKMTYRWTSTYRNEKGVIPKTGFEQFNTRVSLSYKPTKRWDITGSIAYTYSRADKALRGDGGFLQSLMSWPLDDDASNYQKNDGARRKVIDDPSFAELDNPYWFVNKNFSYDKTNRGIANFSFNYEINKWWNITWRAGADFYSTFGTYFYHPESNGYQGVFGRVEDYSDKNLAFSSVLLNTFKKNVGKLKAVLRVGLANDDINRQVYSIRGDSLQVGKDNGVLENTSLGKRLTSKANGRDTIRQRRLIGAFGEIELNYDDILIARASGRNDWTSTLPSDVRSFFYPSASLAFVWSDLIAKNSKVLTLGKFRGSVAQTAKDIAPYADQSVYTVQTSSGLGSLYGFTNNSPGIRPERQETYELGADFQFFSGRIGIEATYFNTRITNSIVNNVRLSYGTGFVLSTLNAMSLKNSGIELTVTGHIIKSKDFNWKTTINFSKSENQITEIPGNLPEFYISDTWLADFRASLFPGGTTTTIGGLDYLKNSKGDVLIDPGTGYPLQSVGYTKIGERQPDFTMGIQNTFNYKSLSLSFLIDWRKGGDILNANEIWMVQRGISKRTLNREQYRILPGVLRDGLEETANPTKNTILILPYTQNDYYTGRTFAVDYVEKDIWWVRLRDVTISYGMPKKWFANSKVFSGLNVFLTGTDLFMFTNYSGVDPTAAGNPPSTPGVGSFGIDFGSLSVPRGVNFGLRVNFKN